MVIRLKLYSQEWNDKFSDQFINDIGHVGCSGIFQLFQCTFSQDPLVNAKIKQFYILATDIVTYTGSLTKLHTMLCFSRIIIETSRPLT